MTRSLLKTLFLFVLSVFLQAQSLQIHHINVGQGDCTLFVSPSGKTLLIDAGSNNRGSADVIPYLQNLGVAKLDYVIATHYHADHIGGMDEVLSWVSGAKLGTVYDRGTAHPVPSTAVYSAYANAANLALGGHEALTVGTIIDLGGGVTFKCLATDGNVLTYGTVANATSSENDLSSAWLVSYNEFRYFTGGDCGGESSSYADLETPIATHSGVGQVDAFKVDHHGSVYSTNQTFLNAINPTAAIIMVGNGNSYFHPVQSILDRLATANCYTYLTETGNGGTVAANHGVVANGNIILTTTGHNTYTVSYGAQTDTYPIHLPSTNTVSVSVSPTTITLTAGSTQPFKATVAGTTTTTVTWTSSGGSITSDGFYTAPATAGTYTVTATSTVDKTKSASATVTVTGVVSVAINPISASLATGATQQFTATVSNTSNTAVTWTTTGGSISTTGLFTAPSTPGTYTVKATSAANTTKFASAIVTVTSASFTEVESNDTLATANGVGANVTKIIGYFRSTSDNNDYFAVTLLAGHTLTVDMTGPTASSQNYNLYLYNSTGTQLAKSENTGTTEHLSYKNTNTTASKTIYINVRRVASYSTATPYTLTLTR